jgi:hypothetical protein
LVDLAVGPSEISPLPRVVWTLPRASFRSESALASLSPRHLSTDDLCLGESSFRPVSALARLPAPVSPLPAHPPHFPPRRSRFAPPCPSTSLPRLVRRISAPSIHRPPSSVPTTCSASSTAAGVAPWRLSTVSSVEVSAVSSPLLRRVRAGVRIDSRFVPPLISFLRSVSSVVAGARVWLRSARLFL